MDKIEKFHNVFRELFQAKAITTTDFGNAIGVSASSVSLWLNGKRKIGLQKALKICDFFECSLQFLIGRTDVQLDFTAKQAPSFYFRLRQVMLERGVSWYRICTDLNKSNRHLYRWQNGCDPYLETVVEFADYFKMTVDAFVGRE